MARTVLDPGLGQKLQGNLGKLINDNGEFSVRRLNAPAESKNVYIDLVNISWKRFFLIIVLGFIGINIVFTILYILNGVEHLVGITSPLSLYQCCEVFFFSVHTLTTVGYGNIAPNGLIANLLSIVEIFIGILYVALITGLLYARFSKPSSHILYSKNILVSPYNNGTALMFRIANARESHMTNADIEVWLTYIDKSTGTSARKYTRLQLERDDITFFTFTWTIVHPIDENSPFYLKNHDDLETMDAQVFSLLKVYDHTFSQNVTSLNSYVVSDIIWDASFEIAYSIAHDGVVEVHLNALDNLS